MEKYESQSNQSQEILYLELFGGYGINIYIKKMSPNEVPWGNLAEYLYSQSKSAHVNVNQEQICAAIRDYIGLKGKYPIEDILKVRLININSQSFNNKLRKIINWIDSGEIQRTQQSIQQEIAFQKEEQKLDQQRKKEKRDAWISENRNTLLLAEDLI